MTEADRIDTLCGFLRIIRIIEKMPVDDVSKEIEEAILKIYMAAVAARDFVRAQERKT